MSRFTGPVNLVYNENKLTAKTLEQLFWEMDYLGSNQVVAIPAGFETDGFTMPFFLRWFMPRWDNIGVRAAILHDYLRTMISQGTPNKYCPTWAIANRQFYLALVALGHSKSKSYVLLQGVEMFTFWKTHTGQDPFTPSKKTA